MKSESYEYMAHTLLMGDQAEREQIGQPPTDADTDKVTSPNT